MLVPEAVVKRPMVDRGTSRNEVISMLGAPKKSAVFRPPRAGTTFSDAPASLRSVRVSRLDEYSVSGLVQLPGDDYRSEMNIYPVFFILTAGASEAICLPLVTGDLAVRSVVRHRLRLWYDARERLLDYKRN